MRVGPIVLAVAAALPSFADSRTEQVSVPFVGCPADGQAGPIDAPQGAPKVVALRRVIADQIAYYKGEQSFGVFAPRGWHCEVLYGSSGSSIVVSPATLNPSELAEAKIHDQAVELEYRDGGTSGRFSVAAYASRLFPKLAEAFVAKVKSEGIEPASEFERGPYVSESVRYPAEGVAEFVTPANTSGLGTDFMLAPNRDAIRGVAVLRMSEDWGIAFLRVRLHPDRHDVGTAVIQLNEACMRSPGGC